jgi:hypothetical protein
MALGGRTHFGLDRSMLALGAYSEAWFWLSMGASSAWFLNRFFKCYIILVMDTTFDKIYNLLALPDGWNGYDGSVPKYGAVEYAHHWINLLYHEVTSSGQKWLDPNITASGEGEVVFEWWQGSKKLTIYVGNQSAEYVKVWGPDINTDMEDGLADSPDMRGLLWKWLMG